MESALQHENDATALTVNARRSLVASWRAFNTSVDNVFYDVTALSESERRGLSAYVVPESSIVVVYPGAARAAIRVLRPIDFVQEQLARTHDAIDTIVLAGVGSSAVGTAALARNVADHTGKPVAGVVSGLGVADIVAEALGGWFILGTANALRDIVARTLDAYEVKDPVRDQRSHDHIKASVTALGLDKNEFIFGSPDSTILLYLLSTLGHQVRMLVGHSKGNYSIDNALRGWVTACRRRGEPLRTDLRIVTLGAVIRLPREFSNVYQFIGTADYFGMMNSRPFLQCRLVTGKWHSLNRRFRSELSVHDALVTADLPRHGLAPVSTPTGTPVRESRRKARPQRAKTRAPAKRPRQATAKRTAKEQRRATAKTPARRTPQAAAKTPAKHTPQATAKKPAKRALQATKKTPAKRTPRATAKKPAKRTQRTVAKRPAKRRPRSAAKRSSKRIARRSGVPRRRRG